MYITKTLYTNIVLSLFVVFFLFVHRQTQLSCTIHSLTSVCAHCTWIEQAFCLQSCFQKNECCHDIIHGCWHVTWKQTDNKYCPVAFRCPDHVPHVAHALLSPGSCYWHFPLCRSDLWGLETATRSKNTWNHCGRSKASNSTHHGTYMYMYACTCIFVFWQRNLTTDTHELFIAHWSLQH